jgi:hypothetical protein
MEMNKKDIDQLAAFITEDPSEFSPDPQVSGGAELEEGLMRAGVLNEFLGGSDDGEEFTAELTTTGTGNWWVLFKGKNFIDTFNTETLAVDAAKAHGAEQVTVKPIPKKAKFVEPVKPLEVPEDFGAEEDQPLPEPFHNQARGGAAAGPDAGQYFGA